MDSIDEFSFHIPNLSLYTTNGRRSTFSFIRGVGTIDLTTASGIGFYVDDVSYLNPILFNIPLYDVERIEILRGPQGTLYGRNALAGVINIVSVHPVISPESEIAFSFGNFNLQQYEWMLNTPLADEEMFLRLSGIYANHDGYTENGTTGVEAQDQDEVSGRIQLRWLPTDNFELNLKFERERFRNGGSGVSPLPTTKWHHISSDFEALPENAS